MKNCSEQINELGEISGFAGGSYKCKCVTCGDLFVGGKRATQCLRCAIDTLIEEVGAISYQRGVGDILNEINKLLKDTGADIRVSRLCLDRMVLEHSSSPKDENRYVVVEHPIIPSSYAVMHSGTYEFKRNGQGVPIRFSLMSQARECCYSLNAQIPDNTDKQEG